MRHRRPRIYWADSPAHAFELWGKRKLHPLFANGKFARGGRAGRIRDWEKNPLWAEVEAIKPFIPDQKEFFEAERLAANWQI